MTSCWDETPMNRPSMDYVVRVMKLLCEYFSGADDPLDYDNIDEVRTLIN